MLPWLRLPLARYARASLQPGETTTASLAFTAHDFAVADEEGSLATAAGVWRVQLGEAAEGVYHDVVVA